NGPSLPVQISKEIGVDTLFASAFLSELISEREIKTSNMKVGNSTLYFLSGQEQKLENFSHYLKSREREAFELLKQKKFLKDSEQEPAIRVALRAIKDFAIPFEKNKKIIWRYFNIPESEFQEEKSSETKQKEIPKQELKNQVEEIKRDSEKQEETKEKTNQESEKELNIFDKEKETKEKLIKEKSKTKKKTKRNSKKSEKFFNRVKEYLSEKNIEILDIESFSKDNLLLRTKKNEKEELLFAYNKKRITEQDIIKANKKASEINLHYKMISLGEPLKKLMNLIEAAKNLSGIEKIK
ncbi:hypothetical protein DRN73_10050, partial [Candidatus Pacearchaeota archaeon]